MVVHVEHPGGLGLLRRHLLVRYYAGHNPYQPFGEREHDDDGDDVEDRVEHRELGLGQGERRREQGCVCDLPTARESHYIARQDEYDHTGDVEQKVYQRGALRIGSAAESGEYRHDNISINFIE